MSASAPKSDKNTQITPASTHWSAVWQSFLPESSVIMARKINPVSHSSLEVPEISNSEEAAEVEGAEAEAAVPQVLESGKPDSTILIIGKDFGSAAHPKLNGLLQKMLEALGLQLKEVVTLGLIDFDRDEKTGADLLRKKLSTYSPRLILSFGELACRLLLQKKDGLEKIRGEVFSFGALKLIPTWHPTDLLQNSELKRESWSDLKKAASEMGLNIPSKR